jgi:hypothetical protein
MALARRNAQPRNHLLNEVADGQQHDQQPEQMQAVLTTGLHVRRDGPSIIVRFHDDQAGAKDHQEGHNAPLPRTPDHDSGCGSGHGILLFHHAHRRNPPISSLDGSAGLGCSFAVSACTQIPTRGILGSPVERHTRRRGLGLRTARILLFWILFMVPPCAIHASAGDGHAEAQP